MLIRAALDPVSAISWYVCRSVTLCVGGLLLSTTCAQSCFAESVFYLGRDFRVDKLERIDGDQLSIELDNQAFLVRSADAGRQVFQMYAQKPELLIAEGLNRDYGSFIGSLAAHEQMEDASLALRGLLSSTHVPDEQKIMVFSGIAATTQGQTVLLKEVLDAHGNARKGSCLALRSIAPDGQLTIKKQLTSDASWIASQCPRILITAAQAYFDAGDRAEGGAILGFVGDFFAGSGGEIAQAAKTSSERVISVQKAIDSGNADQLESELRVASFDSLLGEYYQKLKSSLVVEFSEHAFGKHDAAAVLRGVSLLDFSQRTNQHHELLLRATQEMTCKDLKVLQMDVVKKMLVAYSSKDEVLKQQYISFLNSCIEQAGGGDDARPGIGFVSLLSDVRPDPNVENDILRSNLAESFLDRGDAAGASTVLANVQTRLPWIYRFRLLIKSDAYVLGMVLLGLLVVVRWLLKAGGLLRGTPSSHDASSSGKATETGRPTSRKGKNKERRRSHYSGTSLSKQIYRELDEYGDCLSKLGLEPGVSLSEIKNAYRHIVKELHPDLNPNATKEDTDRFIELTKTYERLVVLHEERETRGSNSEE